MKPGKPLTFATLETRTRGSTETRQVLVFGLPGNPVSSAVTFNLFAVPAIRLLSGWSKPNLRRCAFLTFQSNDEVHHATKPLTIFLKLTVEYVSQYEFVFHD